MAAAVMPVDFFQVKRGKPRGSIVMVGIFTVFILLATLVTFVILAYDGSKHVSTVSEVKTEDLTGIDGWQTCTMISKVNDEYALSTNSSFILVNVMESKVECTSSLAAASPCTSDYVQLLGYDSSFTNSYWDNGMAIDHSSGNIWGPDSLSDGSSLYVYKPSIGAAVLENMESTSITTSPTSAIDIDSTGRVVTAYYGSNGIHYYDPSSGAESFIGLSVQPIRVAIDSSDVVWFSCQNYTLAKNWYSMIYKYDPSTNSEELVASFSNYTTGRNTIIDLMSIGPSGGIWGVITIDYTLYNIFKYDTSSDETTISIVANVTIYGRPTGFTMNSGGIAWLLYASGILVRYDTLSGEFVEVDTLSKPSLNGASPYFQGLVSDSSGALFFARDGVLYRYNPTTETLEALQDYTSGVASWFVCGDETYSKLPVSDAQNLAACSLNGVKWQVSIHDGTFFNSAELESWASTYVANKCTSEIYDAVCEVVGELPPYICTKEVKLGISSYIGVAAANAEVLYAALVFLCGLVLDIVTAYLTKNRNNGKKNNSKGEEAKEVPNPCVELAVFDNARTISRSGALGVSQQSMDKAIAAALEAFSSKEHVKYDRKIAALQKEFSENKETQNHKIAALESEMARLQGELDLNGTKI